MAAATTAALLLASHAQAGPLFSFENPADIDTTPPSSPPAPPPSVGFVWGHSFDANQVQHAQSTVGATDGGFSMHVNDPDGGFSWHSQVLFNDPPNQPRFGDLTSSTKWLMDISTPGAAPVPNTLPQYAVGFGAINYGGGFIDSYNTGAGGKNYQFASSPQNQAELTTQTYTWDFGGQMRFQTGSLWPGLTDYVILHFNGNSPAGSTDYYYDNVRAVNEDTTVRPTWNTVATGDWSNSANWNNGVPNAVGAPAIFYGIGASNGTAAIAATVNVNSAVTVGSIIFDAQMTTHQFNGADAAVTGPELLPAIVNYTLAGTGSLTMDVSTGASEIYVIAGNHNVNVPVTLNDNTAIDTSAGFGPDSNPGLPGGGRFSSVPRTSVAFGAPVTVATGATLSTRGAGSVTFGNTVTGGALDLRGGRVNFAGNVNTSSLSVSPAARVAVLGTGSTVLRTAALNLGSGSLASSLDLTNNKMIVDYTGASPLSDVRARIINAYAAGSWNGTGITTSLGNASTHGLGYGEASALFSAFPATFAGQSVDDTAVLVAYARYGDANLDGTVNLQDFNRLAAGFGTAGSAVWTQGDFNYDGNVNLQDFNRLAANFGQSAAGTELTPQDWANLASAIPEPATGIAALLAIAALAPRRRRRRRPN
jgi:hypothetical protein